MTATHISFVARRCIMERDIGSMAMCMVKCIVQAIPILLDSLVLILSVSPQTVITESKLVLISTGYEEGPDTNTGWPKDDSQ